MKLLNITLIFIFISLFSCKSKPKVIVEDAPTGNPTTQTETGTATSEATAPSISNSEGDMHQVTAVEILQAERYTYMKVKEKGDPFWIAATKFEPKVGNHYFYRGGLLKTNFESQEHKRVFDKIYLVSSIIDASAHPGGNTEMTAPIATDVPINAQEIKKIKGAIKLSDLIANPTKYNGKLIIVAGKCVKANYGIMNKNWYHIQDGTKKDGKNCDFTITSLDNIPLGVDAAFEGKIILNKDFGAGYVYEILMEDGKLK